MTKEPQTAGEAEALAQSVDPNICNVVNNEDHPDQVRFGELRYVFAEGYNRVVNQVCGDLIRFNPGVNPVMRAPLSINNPSDGDCTSSLVPGICGDGWNLIVDGITPDRATLDVRAVDPQQCAVEVRSDKVQFKNLNLEATLVQIQNGKVLCDHGFGNDFSQVTFNDVAIPEAPTQFSARIEQPYAMVYRARLNWVYSDPTADITIQTQIERASLLSNGTCGPFNRIAELPGSMTSYVDSSLAANKMYCYRVRARREFLTSGYSPIEKIMVPGGAGTLPPSLGTVGGGAVTSSPSGISNNSLGR